jgi:hypothetical protein
MRVSGPNPEPVDLALADDQVCGYYWVLRRGFFWFFFNKIEVMMDPVGLSSFFLLLFRSLLLLLNVLMSIIYLCLGLIFYNIKTKLVW